MMNDERESRRKLLCHFATSFFIQVGIFTLFNWMTSYNRRDLEAVLERQQRLKRHI